MPRLNASELFEMSDEDFMQANATAQLDSPVGSEESSATLQGDGTGAVVETEGQADDNALDTDGGDAAGGDDGGDDDQSAAEDAAVEDVADADFDPRKPVAGKPADKSAEGTGQPVDKPAGTQAPAAPVKATEKAADKPGEKPAEGETQTPAETPAEPTHEELTAFYKEVMKPFKANNREITIRTPQEAIRLMQMGAGYGKKLADLQPHLKALRMLEKAGVGSDENQLSFLIELQKKSPDAIKKLLRDAKIDPLDLNLDENSDYQVPDHRVSDAEAVFTEVLNEVRAAPNGTATIKHVNDTWDEQSKAALWRKPEILRVIQTQREAGIYDRIVTEIERQKIFGTIKAGTPFIEAYRQAGDALIRAAGINPNTQTQQTPETKEAPTQAAPTTPVKPAGPAVLGQGTVKPKAPSATDARVRAAASSTSKAVKTTKPLSVSDLDMSDDEFMKNFGPKYG